MTVRESVRSSLRLLTARDRRRYGLAVATQMATSFLDLIGVGLLGIVGMLSMSIVNGRNPPALFTRLIAPLAQHLPDSRLIAMLAGASVTMLITRNVVNPLLMSRILTFLAEREAAVSARLARQLLRQPLTFVEQRSSQQTAVAILDGTNLAISIVLGQAAVVAAETTLLVLLLAALLMVNPAVAVGVVAYFALVSVGLHRATGHRAARLSVQRRRSHVAAFTAVQEAVGSYREIMVADRRMYYASRIRGLRLESARATAGIQLVAMLPKYVSEGALALGAFALAAVLFSTEPAGVAAGTFAVFLAAATRVMPSLLRLQGALLSLRSASAAAEPTYRLAEELGDADEEIAEPIVVAENADFTPSVELRDVSFTYPEAQTPALAGINLNVGEAQSVALVGRSGAGKSTLADVILGVLEPDSGVVALGGIPPAEAVRRWPGSIGYVPQDVMLTRDSVRANVALGVPPDAIEDDLIWESLRRAHLDQFVREQPAGLDTEVGERGLRLSGGQRQRLGIARALFTRPRLVVLDEATSALDSETEHAITTMLDELGDDVTTVIIAHRLSTVRHADLVAYLEDGRVIATGTFDEVCDRVPALRNQADLMGLGPGPTS